MVGGDFRDGRAQKKLSKIKGTSGMVLGPQHRGLPGWSYPQTLCGGCLERGDFRDGWRGLPGWFKGTSGMIKGDLRDGFCAA